MFDTKIQGYNGSMGPFEATINMVPSNPHPQRKGRVPQCARNKHAGGSGVRLNDGPDIKLFILVGLGRNVFCLMLGPPGFNCWFSSAPVFQWCCSTPRGSPGVGRNTFLSSPHLCFIIVFICDLFVSRDGPLMS